MTQPLDESPEPSATWATALARGLIRDDALRTIHYCDAGYIDLLESTPPTRRTQAQRAMQNKTVAALYERIWRPIAVER